jgi:UDPglucose 6-dehydrogenase
LNIAQAISRAGARVVAYDPLAADNARRQLPEVVILDSVVDCLSQADVVLITTPDPVFARLTPAEVLAGKEQVTVVDFWRILDHALSGHPSIEYIPIGRGAGDPSLAISLAALWSDRREPTANLPTHPQPTAATTQFTNT